MLLVPDAILDRMRLKRKLIFWRICVILLIAVLAFCLTVQGSPSNKRAYRDYIARIRIDGIILDDPAREKILSDLAENPRVKAVIVHIDSPGGTIVGGESLYEDLQSLAEKKPVVSVMDSIAASGGYMAALGTNYIVARQGTITGSIGVMLQTADVTEMGKKLGVSFYTVKSSPLKGTPSPLEPLTPEAKKALQDSLDDAYGLFIEMLMKGRKMDKTTALALADGRVYTGRQAKVAGLVDALGDEKKARLWLEEEKHIGTHIETIDVDTSPTNENFLNSVLGTAAGWLGTQANAHSGQLWSYYNPSGIIH